MIKCLTFLFEKSLKWLFDHPNTWLLHFLSIQTDESSSIAALVVSLPPGVVCYLWVWGGFEGHVWSQQLVGTECLCMSVEPAPQISGSRCSFPRQQGLTGLWHSGRHCLGIQTEKKTQTNYQERREVI